MSERLFCGRLHASVSEIVDAGEWTRAEEYHQKYLEKYPSGYTCHFMRD